jgi:hypothetical protein
MIIRGTFLFWMQDMRVERSFFATYRVGWAVAGVNVLLWITACLGPSPALAIPTGLGAARLNDLVRDELAMIEKTRVVCSRERIGDTIRTWSCEDGYVCAPGNKCKPGPEMQRRLDAERQRTREELQRRLKAIEAHQRQLRQQLRRSYQAAVPPRSDGRQIGGYNGDPRAIRSNCSTITGLPGGAPPTPCVTSRRTFQPTPARQRAQPTPAAMTLHQKIYRNLPPNTLGVIAATTESVDDDWIERFVTTRNRPPPATRTATATATATATTTAPPVSGRIPFILCPGVSKSTSTSTITSRDTARTTDATPPAAANDRHPCLQKAKWTRAEPYNHGPDSLVITPFYGPRFLLKPGEELWSVQDPSITGGRRLEGRPWDHDSESGSTRCTELNVQAPRTEAFRVRMDCEIERQEQSQREFESREDHYMARSACKSYKPNAGWEKKSTDYWKTHREEPTGWCFDPSRGSDLRPVRQENWRSVRQCQDDPKVTQISVDKRGVIGCPP